MRICICKKQEIGENIMTTYANIHKERTSQLKEYFECRKSIYKEKDFYKNITKEWVESQLWEIGTELILRGEMTWEEFLHHLNMVGLQSCFCKIENEVA